MQNTALEATEALVRTPGFPLDWVPATVRVIGLAERENILNLDKVKDFVSLDYNDSKVLLGVGNYEYNFSIQYPNGSIVTLFDGTILRSGLPHDPATTVVPVERYVILDGPKRLSFILWR